MFTLTGIWLTQGGSVPNDNIVILVSYMFPGAHYFNVSDVYIDGNLVDSGGILLNDNDADTCVTMETTKCANFKDVKHTFLSV